MNNSPVRTRIRSARLASGLSQQRLGEAIGTSGRAIRFWESAEGNEPLLRYIRLLGAALGVRPEWLAFGSGKRLAPRS